MRILVTGFAPFGASRVNPSWEAVRRLPAEIGEHEVVTAQLPVEYGRAGDLLAELIARHAPDCVLCVGQAAGREGISLENTAVNVRAANAPDNAGVTYSGSPVVEGGPESLPARLPLKELSFVLREAGLQAKISYSAGTYVCNDVFYRLMYYIATEENAMLGGFIHIPPDAEQAADFAPGTPTLPTAEVVRALKLCIASL